MSSVKLANAEIKKLHFHLDIYAATAYSVIKSQAKQLNKGEAK